jgi:pimeloyl-ACP methyl ester carboxylesterase
VKRRPSPSPKSPRHGPIWFRGREAGRPVVLLITGFLADERLWDLAPDMLPEFDYLRVHLPGNHSPPLAASDVATVAAAISEAIAVRFGDRPLLLAGFSLGATVALGVRAPNLTRRFLVEPILDTEGLWPIEEWGRKPLAAADAALLWAALGVRGDEVERRDYRRLLEMMEVPADVVFGGEPLEPRRPTTALPSFVSQPVRERIGRHPDITTHVFAGGHNVAGQAAWPLFRILRQRALESLLRADQPPA